MKAKRATRASPGQFETRMDMTPLIDCVFLLVMFFILTTEIAVQVEDVTLPIALEGERENGRQNDRLLVINVKLNGDRSRRGEIVYNTQSQGLESLTAALEKEVATDEIVDQRQRRRSRGGQPLSELGLLIRADKDADSEQLRTIFTAASKAGIYKIRLSTLPPEGD